MKLKKTLALCGAALTAVCAFAAFRADMPRYHYEVRRDLSIYFSNADRVIEQVREGLRTHSSKITITYTSGGDNMSDIREVVDEIMRYAMSETDDPCEGDYIYHQYGGYELECTCESDGESFDYVISIVPCYYTYLYQEQAVTEKVNDILSSLNIKGMSDREKINAIYNYVYENVSYDYVHKKNKYYHLKTTAYAALFNGCAVCQGYSVLMYRLLREAGINARVITGTAYGNGKPEFHAWNIVLLDGKYYNIDVTWDRLTGTHDYFMKGSESFSKDHTPDSEFCGNDFLSLYPVSEIDN